MKKQDYEKYKALKNKVKSGTANFKERNVFTIIQKKKDKKQS